MIIVYLILAGLGIYALVRLLSSFSASGTPPRRQAYPYRPDVEQRLPDGSITTHGYAAAHPTEFRHWEHGPTVLGERIDRADWENWRLNYFGQDGT